MQQIAIGQGMLIASLIELLKEKGTIEPASADQLMKLCANRMNRTHGLTNVDKAQATALIQTLLK